MKKVILFLLVVLLQTNCIKRPVQLNILKTQFTSLEGWDKENHKEAIKVFIQSCSKFDKQGWQNFLLNSKLELQDVDNDFLKCSLAPQFQHSSLQAKKFFEKFFDPYIVSNNYNPEGLFTGYFELELKGSLAKTKEFKYPIYAKPLGLEKNKPYFSRQQIENGILANKGLEIAYTNDPARLFFLHIQGSGIISLANSKTKIKVNYDGQNGHKYFPIGKYLSKVERIEKELINANFIMNWLSNYDFKAKEVFKQNPSYIFFKVNNYLSPIGAAGIPLTTERSLAIDRKFLPLGSIFWVETNYTETKKEFKKLMISQDTGGAIKGPVRGDIFFGSGNDAERKACYMNSKGRYYILLPKKVGQV